MEVTTQRMHSVSLREFLRLPYRHASVGLAGPIPVEISSEFLFSRRREFVTNTLLEIPG